MIRSNHPGIHQKVAYKSFMGFCVLLLLIFPATAHTLTGSAAYPDHIFKCQRSIIWGNFSGGVISDVWLKLTRATDGAQEVYLMTSAGAGKYNYSYGNSNLTTWGNKSISYIVKDGGVNSTNTSSAYVFVYSDDCTGSNMTNMSLGIGNYTNRLNTMGFIEWFAVPYTEYWGDAFYFLLIVIAVSMVYMKNQNIAQPILIAFIGLALLAGSLLIPAEYRQYAMLLMGLGLAAIFWKVFKS